MDRLNHEYYEAVPYDIVDGINERTEPPTKKEKKIPKCLVLCIPFLIVSEFAFPNFFLIEARKRVHQSSPIA